MSDQHEDMAELIALPAFRRFMWRSIQSAGILSQATTGADGRDLSYAEGRRSLMFALLSDVEQGQPAPLQTPHSIMTLIAVFREAANPAPKEKRSGTGRYTELDG